MLKKIVIMSVFLLAVGGLVTGAVAGNRISLTGEEQSVTIPAGQGCKGSRYTMQFTNNTTSAVFDIEVKAIGWWPLQGVKYIDVHLADGTKIQDDSKVKAVNYMESGRVEYDVEDDDPEEDGVGGMNWPCVESNFSSGVPDGGNFDVTIELQDEDCDKFRTVTVKPTSAGGGFFCYSYSAVDGFAYLASNQAGQSIPDIYLGEDTAAIFTQETIYISPLTPNWEFSGTPTATVTAGDLSIGSALVLDGEILVPILQQSTSSSVITISDVTADTEELPDSVLMAVAAAPGGCVDELIVGGLYEPDAVPALTKITMLILIVLMLTTASVFIYRKRLSASSVV